MKSDEGSGGGGIADGVLDNVKTNTESSRRVWGNGCMRMLCGTGVLSGEETVLEWMR